MCAHGGDVPTDVHPATREIHGFQRVPIGLADGVLKSDSHIPGGCRDGCQTLATQGVADHMVVEIDVTTGRVEGDIGSEGDIRVELLVIHGADVATKAGIARQSKGPKPGHGTHRPGKHDIAGRGVDRERLNSPAGCAIHGRLEGNASGCGFQRRVGCQHDIAAIGLITRRRHIGAQAGAVRSRNGQRADPGHGSGGSRHQVGVQF